MAKNNEPRTGLPHNPIDYFFTVVLSWLVPGSGHWLLGYRVRGLVIGGTLLATFWVGESLLAENKAISRKVHPVFFGLQAGNGFSSLLSDYLWGTPVDESGNEIDAEDLRSIDRSLPRHINLGILLCSISGLLNMLVVLHVMDPRTWREAASRPWEEGDGPADGAAGSGSKRESTKRGVSDAKGAVS